jgi:hypothetical protein
MKKIITFFFVVILASSCERNATDGTAVSQAVTSGNWRVSHFSERGNDETSDFNGYSFLFNNDGSVSVTKNGITTSGTWSVGNSSRKFNIDLGPKIDANKPLGELTDDWQILSNSATEIRLTDDNSSSSEFLTFTKN